MCTLILSKNKMDNKNEQHDSEPRVNLAGIDIQKAHDTLMVHSLPFPDSLRTVSGFRGYEQELPVSASELFDSFGSTGFQASHLGQAGSIIQKMLRWRLSHDSPEDTDSPKEAAGIFSWNDEEVRRRTRAKIYLSFTSNLISSGLREAFVYLAKNRLVDVIVTTAGGIEEDFIKCLGDSVVGSFGALKGPELRSKGWNRIGNIYVPNENYVKFETWLQPILDECLEKQQKENVTWTPCMLVKEMGKRINNEESLYYWCYKNDIPVYCPCLTDGSIGDNLYFHSVRNPVSK
eukprot:Gregarina_sp_Poly_1__2483@NODE_1672_length_3558_cov_1154_769121_g1098_i0_p2_GENE_NODE_1672_length_3558_cov_1154_769121_g1098_i0NODE_1672_length_3558_cov_1154_769121_g1098_i0_p2_ORF_typecomplete_len290_score26_06DS/PF01916_17/2_7e71_NODE_1672_length_3558_cov_1154_769121_g1098_i04011270